MAKGRKLTQWEKDRKKSKENELKKIGEIVETTKVFGGFSKGILTFKEINEWFDEPERFDLSSETPSSFADEWIKKNT